MTVSSAPLWTLEELSAQVALALAQDAPRQASGRVRDVPDVRTIRYYTTLGLLDRPAQMRGRTALYGRRHLLQLVAIKRLQAKGQSLAEVQTRVAGQTDAALARLAQLPAGVPAPRTTGAAERHSSVPPDEDRRRGGFWAAMPAPPPGDEEAKPAQLEVRPLVGVALDARVTLILEGGRSLDAHEVEALRVAAAPLLKILRTRRILDADEQNQPKGDSP